MDDYRKIFLITSAFDILLNILPPPFGAVILRDYFDKHTKLSAALIAGFTGVCTFAFIGRIVEVGTPSLNVIVTVGVVSALVGIPMQLSGLFPNLNKYYYDRVSPLQSLLADGLSGIMVAIVYWILTNKVQYVPLIIFTLLTTSLYALLLRMGGVVYDV